MFQRQCILPPSGSMSCFVFLDWEIKNTQAWTAALRASVFMLQAGLSSQRLEEQASACMDLLNLFPFPADLRPSSALAAALPAAVPEAPPSGGKQTPRKVLPSLTLSIHLAGRQSQHKSSSHACSCSPMTEVLAPQHVACVGVLGQCI